MNSKILVVEDDSNILELIEFNLTANGYEVFTEMDGIAGLNTAKEIKPDLVVLDLMLPGMDGIDITKNLRIIPETSNIPILMLTAKNSEIDRIIGLEIGADDYMTKPFSVRELLARIKSVLRRSLMPSTSVQIVEEKPKVITIKSLVIDDNRHEVSRNGKVYQLTLKEYELLKILAENTGSVLTRNRLLDEVWGYDYFGETRTVDVHIRHLRMKIEDEDYDRIIETVRGVGYRIIDPK